MSYDPKNVTALSLYARLESEHLQNYETAKNYFQDAIAINMDALAVYPYYIETLLLNEDFKEAENLIDFALTIKGVDKMAILLKKVQLLERQQKIKDVLKLIKDVKLVVYNNDTYELDTTERRLLAKKELLKPKKKSKKNKAEKKKSKK